MEVWCRINQMDVEILARPTGKAKECEPYALDRQSGRVLPERNGRDRNSGRWRGLVSTCPYQKVGSR